MVAKSLEKLNEEWAVEADERLQLKDFFQPDGSLDLQKLSWLSMPQINAFIKELHSKLQMVKAQNSILRGKCHTYEITIKAKDSNNKRLNRELAQAELDLYDLKYRGGKK